MSLTHLIHKLYEDYKNYQLLSTSSRGILKQGDFVCNFTSKEVFEGINFTDVVCNGCFKPLMKRNNLLGIFYAYEGVVNVYLDNNPLSLQAGNFCINDCNINVSNCFDFSAYKGICIYIDLERTLKVIHSYLPSFDPDNLYNKLKQDSYLLDNNPQIIGIFRQILHYHHIYPPTYLRLKVLECLLALENLQVSYQSYNKIIETIKNELLFGQISLKEICQKYQISEPKLRKEFLRVVKQPISDFLTEQKLSRAKALLNDTSLSVIEIAYECGYANPSKFSSFFKKHLGITPKTFRKTSTLNVNS